MSRAPDLSELVGGGLPEDERARLQRVHDMLLAAGATPELPPWLAQAPREPPARIIPSPRRHRSAALVAAAALALALFGAGYAIGGHEGARKPVRVVAMTGPGGAVASIAVFAADPAGNWPMTLEVSGLPALPGGRTYELWLTRGGRLAEPCGAFTVSGGTTEVPLNAPYRLKQFDGWVVVRSGERRPVLSAT